MDAGLECQHVSSGMAVAGKLCVAAFGGLVKVNIDGRSELNAGAHEDVVVALALPTRHRR